MKRFFNSRFTYFICGMLVIGLTSCIAPSSQVDNAQKRVEVTEAKIDVNQAKTIDQIRGYTYATDLTLSLDPKPTKYTSVAKEFSSRSVATIGLPDLQEIKDLKEIVTNLLSENKDLLMRGKMALEKKDMQVYELQNQLQSLKTELDVKQDKLLEVSREAAALGDKWWKLKNYFWWGVWILGIGFFISIAGSVLPPPYNTIASLVALPIGAVVKLITGIIPSVKSFAGTVSQSAYNESQTTLKHIITAIEEAKRDKPDVVKEIVPYLKNETSNELSKLVITKVKQELGYV